MSTKKGTVKFYNEQKGYGFITNNDGGEIFVHATGIKDQITQGDQVTYEEQEGKRGLNAVNVKRS